MNDIVKILIFSVISYAAGYIIGGLIDHQLENKRMEGTKIGNY